MTQELRWCGDKPTVIPDAVQAQLDAADERTCPGCHCTRRGFYYNGIEDPVTYVCETVDCTYHPDNCDHEFVVQFGRKVSPHDRRARFACEECSVEVEPSGPDADGRQTFDTIYKWAEIGTDGDDW